MTLIQLFIVTHTSTKLLLVTVELNQAPVDMEVDTGASVSLISKDTYDKLWPDLTTAPPPQKFDILLRTYTGEHLDVVSSVSVYQYMSDVTRNILLTFPDQDWLRHIKLDWKALHLVGTPPTLACLLDCHEALFHDKLGTMKDTSAKSHVDSQTRPRFYKPHPISYAMWERVEQETDRLKQEGILQPVEFSDWAAPIVLVLKNDSFACICGDYKLTANWAAKVGTYSLPRIEDLLASLADGKSFSKWDLAHAYQQIELEEESRKYVTINTHKGFFSTPDYHLVWLLLQQCSSKRWRTFSIGLIMYVFTLMTFLLKGH